MRRQYHSRMGPEGRMIWDVHRLVELAKDLPVIEVPLSGIRELDEPYWFGGGEVPTCRLIAEHARQMDETDLQYPILLSADGRVMDGMHRVVKALVQGLDRLPAKQFQQNPVPDYINVDLDDLPY